MPELAEVEYYRKQWNAGMGDRTVGISGHFEKRIYRQTAVASLRKELVGARLISSAAHGKQMIFRFEGDLWLGLHLGMTGRLHMQPPAFVPGKHDHLVIYQKKRALVFTDARQFGRVLFHQGTTPSWWREDVPAIDSAKFSVAWVKAVLQRHRKLPIKAALLLQHGFPGIGNWMADEVLWQARLHPRTLAGNLSVAQVRQLRLSTRSVVRKASQSIGEDFSDPPAKWLFHQRWKRKGHCPREGTALSYATVGGRTTVWCPHCQASQREGAHERSRA